MEIRIRNEGQNESDHLHDGTLAEALELVAHMRLIGVKCGDGDMCYKLVPQFVITDDGAYYEIVVVDE